MTEATRSGPKRLSARTALSAEFNVEPKAMQFSPARRPAGPVNLDQKMTYIPSDEKCINCKTTDLRPRGLPRQSFYEGKNMLNSTPPTEYHRLRGVRARVAGQHYKGLDRAWHRGEDQAQPRIRAEVAERHGQEGHAQGGRLAGTRPENSTSTFGPKRVKATDKCTLEDNRSCSWHETKQFTRARAGATSP